MRWYQLELWAILCWKERLKGSLGRGDLTNGTDFRRSSAPDDGEIHAGPNTCSFNEKKSESNQHLHVANTNKSIIIRW